jgi:hypothetical protein
MFVEVVVSGIVLLIFHRKSTGKLSDARIYNTLSAGIVYIVKYWSRDEGLWFDCRQCLIPFSHHAHKDSGPHPPSSQVRTGSLPL